MSFTAKDLYMSSRTEFEVIGMVQNHNSNMKAQMMQAAANDYTSQAGIAFETPMNEVDNYKIGDILSESNEKLKNQILAVVNQGANVQDKNQRAMLEKQKQKQIQQILDKEKGRVEILLKQRIERKAFVRHAEAQKRKEDAIVAKSMAGSKEMSANERQTLDKITNDSVASFNSIA